MFFYSLSLHRYCSATSFIILCVTGCVRTWDGPDKGGANYYGSHCQTEREAPMTLRERSIVSNVNRDIPIVTHDIVYLHLTEPTGKTQEESRAKYYSSNVRTFRAQSWPQVTSAGRNSLHALFWNVLRWNFDVECVIQILGQS